MKNLTNRKHLLRSVLTLGIFLAIIINMLLSYILSKSYMEYPSLEQENWSYLLKSEARSQKEQTAFYVETNENAWRKVDEFGRGFHTKEKITIYFRYTLPKEKVRDACIMIQTNDQAFQVHVDEQLIYEFGDFEHFDFKHSPGSPVHLVCLPQGYEGKELTIRMKSVSAKRLGLIREISLDSKSNHIMRIFKVNISTLVLGCLDLIIGIAAVLIATFHKLGRKALLSLGFSFLTVGVWSISENGLTQLFHFRPEFWFYTAIISFYLIPISVYTFIKDISKSHIRIMSILIETHILVFAISLALEISGIVPIIDTLIYHYMFTGISYIVCLSIGAYSYLKGSSKAAAYTLGLLIFGIFGIYDVLGWYFQILNWRINLAPWGMFLFQAGLIYSLIQYLQDVQEKFRLYRESIKSNYNKLKEKDKQIDQVMEHEKIRTEFFANISHELRTPLNIISSTIQLIKMYNQKGMLNNNDVKIDKYMKIMNQNCLRLMKLVNNLIDITKIDSGFYKLRLRNINIIGLIEDITLSIEEYAKNKGIRLSFDTSIEEAVISCDPDAIERIMLNLLSNAIKFSNTGDSVHVFMEDEGGQLKIIVEDTGIGIPKEELGKIFDRFMQVDKSFTRQNEGSGIGLTLVKSLVELQGGSIQVESELNSGSRFIICLPKAATPSENIEIIDGNISGEKLEKVSIEFSDISN